MEKSLVQKIRYKAERIKFNNSIYFFFFIAFMIAAFSVHLIFKIDAKNNMSAILSVFVLFVNIFLSNRLNFSAGRLEEAHPVQYKYLPGRYRKVSDMNGWIPISFLCLILFIHLEWFDSMSVILIYWIADFFYRKYKIQRAIELTNSDIIGECLNLYSGLRRRKQTADLKFLLSRGLQDEENKCQVIQMFSSLFWSSMKGEVKRIKENQNKWEFAYREIYHAAGGWIEEICGTHGENNIELDKLWILFMNDLEKLLREDTECDTCAARTVLSAVLFFAMSGVSRRQQKYFFSEFGRIEEREGLTEDNDLHSIMLLFLEFTFQYHEEKERLKISLDREVVFLYKHSLKMSDKKDIDFYRFLWLLWVCQANQTLSKAVISFESLMKYCAWENGISDSSNVGDNKFDLLKTRSLYVLIKEMQPEQEMIL